MGKPRLRLQAAGFREEIAERKAQSVNPYLSPALPVSHGIARGAEGIYPVDPMRRWMHQPNIPGTKNRCQVTNLTSALKALERDQNVSFSTFSSDSKEDR